MSGSDSGVSENKITYEIIILILNILLVLYTAINKIYKNCTSSTQSVTKDDAYYIEKMQAYLKEKGVTGAELVNTKIAV